MQKHFYHILLGCLALCSTTATAADPIWEKLEIPKIAQERNLYSVCFVDAKNGWIVGDKGLCLVTNDGGTSWKLQETGSKAILRCVQFRDVRTGWICGDGDRSAPDEALSGAPHLIMGYGNPLKPGTLLHTTDGGKTWKTHWIPSNFEIHCIEASAAPWIQVGTHGPKSHLDGDFLCSNAGGEKGSWNLHCRCCRSISAMRMIEDKHWVAVGAANRGIGERNEVNETTLWAKPTCRALYSEDNGKTWKFSKGSDGKLDSELRSLAVAQNHTVLAVGDEGVILRSQDAGITWKAVESSTTVDLIGVVWCGPLAIAVGRNGMVVLGKNDGKSWESVRANQNQELYGFAMAGDCVIAVGKKGTALRAKVSELANPKKNDNHSPPSE